MQARRLSLGSSGAFCYVTRAACKMRSRPREAIRAPSVVPSKADADTRFFFSLKNLLFGLSFVTGHLIAQTETISYDFVLFGPC